MGKKLTKKNFNKILSNIYFDIKKDSDAVNSMPVAAYINQSIDKKWAGNQSVSYYDNSELFKQLLPYYQQDIDNGAMTDKDLQVMINDAFNDCANKQQFIQTMAVLRTTDSATFYQTAQNYEDTSISWSAFAGNDATIKNHRPVGFGYHMLVLNDKNVKGGKILSFTDKKAAEETLNVLINLGIVPANTKLKDNQDYLAEQQEAGNLKKINHLYQISLTPQQYSQYKQSVEDENSNGCYKQVGQAIKDNNYYHANYAKDHHYKNSANMWNGKPTSYQNQDGSYTFQEGNGHNSKADVTNKAALQVFDFDEGDNSNANMSIKSM